MQQVAPLLALLLAGCPVAEGPCGGPAADVATLELGQITGGSYAPLVPDEPLLVHSGLDGGFHSDLAVKLSGPGIDADSVGTLAVEAELGLGWTDAQTDPLDPGCRFEDLLHVGRFFYEATSTWDELSNTTVDFDVAVEAGDWSASTRSGPIDTAQGFQVSGGG